MPWGKRASQRRLSCGEGAGSYGEELTPAPVGWTWWISSTACPSGKLLAGGRSANSWPACRVPWHSAAQGHHPWSCESCLVSQLERALS